MQCHDVVREEEDGAHEGAPGGARARDGALSEGVAAVRATGDVTAGERA